MQSDVKYIYDEETNANCVEGNLFPRNALSLPNSEEEEEDEDEDEDEEEDEEERLPFFSLLSFSLHHHLAFIVTKQKASRRFSS